MRDVLLAVAGAVTMILIICLVLAWPTAWLWNTCLVPAVPGLKEVGTWQMLGIMVLFSILFKPTTSK